MSWLSLTLVGAISLLSFSQNVTRAQSPAEPIKAKRRELSYQIQPDGSKVLKQERTGTFYRSSSGAEIRTTGDRSTFIDAQGHIYEINHIDKFVKLVAHNHITPHELIRQLVRTMEPDTKSSITLHGFTGYETVNGVNCAVLPIRSNDKPPGKEYLYLPYGLSMKTEEFANPEGSLLTIWELYDIQVAEPDPALVRIPEGYFIDNTLQQQ
jgi:urease beta subunit